MIAAELIPWILTFVSLDHFSRPSSGVYPLFTYTPKSTLSCLFEMTNTLNHTPHAGAQLSVEKHSADEVNAQILLSA